MVTVLASDKSQSERVDTSVPVEVSVVIPCLNEANSLAFCIDKAVTAFRGAGLSGEVIVADNGSTDGSIQIAEEHGARVVRVEERGFTRAVYERMDLRSTGMEFASEFVIKAAQIKARITEIPITLWPDKRGRPPHLRSFRDGWRHLRFMLLYAPNWLFLLPGGALLAAGLFLVFWLLPGPRQISARVVLDIHTMIFGVIFTLLGVQILSIGSFAKVFSYA